jgi:hypothetical protein
MCMFWIICLSRYLLIRSCKGHSSSVRELVYNVSYAVLLSYSSSILCPGFQSAAYRVGFVRISCGKEGMDAISAIDTWEEEVCSVCHFSPLAVRERAESSSSWITT